jgi:hypothetical protein
MNGVIVFNSGMGNTASACEYLARRPPPGWRCYNNCPAHAISTAKFRGGPFYGGPGDVLKAKLET